MRNARQVAVAVTSTRTQESPRPPRLAFDLAEEAPPAPTPLPRLGAAASIREALRRWLEEDM